MQTVAMVQVDPSDDEIERFVVHRYTYDPVRHQRRYAVAAAFDNSQEFEAAIEAEDSELRRRRESGEGVDPRERISGSVWEAGYHRKQRSGRIIDRAIEHGVRLDEKTWDRLTDELPSNMAVMRFDAEPDA